MEAIVLFSLWFAVVVYACVSTIWGRGAERSYEQRSMFFKDWLLPGRWSNKEHYIRDAKAIAVAMLAVGTMIYVSMVIRLIKEPIQIGPPQVDEPSPGRSRD